MPETPVQALRDALSVERLSTYLRSSGGDDERAIRLYRWNSMVSSAFYGSMQLLEVAVRNATDSQMTEQWGLRWWENPQCPVSPRHREAVLESVQELHRHGHATAHGDVVASLSFGLWVGLFGSGGRGADYETRIWRPALSKALPSRPPKSRRRDIHERIDYLRTLRNRIAHHEPIFGRDLAADHESVLEVLRWVSADVSEWARRYSRVPVALIKKDDVLSGIFEGSL